MQTQSRKPVSRCGSNVLEVKRPSEDKRGVVKIDRAQWIHDGILREWKM